MKKTLSLLLVLALALGLLAGCGGAQSPASTGEAPAESAASIQESAAAAPEDMPGTNPDALIQGEPVEPASAEEPAPEPEEELPQFVASHHGGTRHLLYLVYLAARIDQLHRGPRRNALRPGAGEPDRRAYRLPDRQYRDRQRGLFPDGGGGRLS